MPQGSPVKTGCSCTALLAAVVVCFPLAALAQESGDDTKARLEALEGALERQQSENKTLVERIQTLETERDESWLNERRAEELKTLICEVLSDADTRASLAEGKMTAGHNGKNFFLASEDGRFLLNVGGHVQFRYIGNSRDPAAGASTSPDDDWEKGFQLRRVKVFFEGHIGSPKFTYAVQFAGNRDSTTVELESGYVGYRPGENLNVIFGRFSAPFLRDQTTSSKYQLAVERSLIASVFGGGRNYVEGVGFEYDATGSLRVRGSVNDGLGSGNPGGSATGFLNGPNDFNGDSTDVAGTVRADWKVMGDWKQFSDYSAWSGEATALFFGAAVHYEVAETGDGQASGTTSATGGYDSFVTWTVDGSLESHGFNVMGAFIGNHINTVKTNTVGDLDSYAAMAQVGYMVIPDRLEPFARYEWIGVDGQIATDDIHVLTLGGNYYFIKHAAKLTMDVVWVMQPLTAGNTLGATGSTGTGLTGLGLLADPAGADDQVSFRAQFQLLF